MKTKKKILYVDDEEINILLFKTLMSKNYEVITANNGEHGLEMLKNNTVDFVISDMRMPGMTGLEFIKKANEIYSEIQYFILTGYSIDDEIEDAIKNNLIVKYWGKPGDFEAIDKFLESLN
jgi:response regulator RpfG family c-di-GMP phosphodiesterase